MNNEQALNYLKALANILKNNAKKAKVNYESTKLTRPIDEFQCAFDAGICLAYYNIITLMQKTADALQIPLSELELHDIKELEFLFNR